MKSNPSIASNKTTPPMKPSHRDSKEKRAQRAQLPESPNFELPGARSPASDKTPQRPRRARGKDRLGRPRDKAISGAAHLSASQYRVPDAWKWAPRGSRAHRGFAAYLVRTAENKASIGDTSMVRGARWLRRVYVWCLLAFEESSRLRSAGRRLDKARPVCGRDVSGTLRRDLWALTGCIHGCVMDVRVFCVVLISPLFPGALLISLG